MEKNKRHERGIKLFVVILCVIIFAPIILLIALDWFINDTDLVIGITGFAQKVAFRSALSLAVLIIAIVCLVKFFLSEKRIRHIIGYFAGIFLCAAVIFFAVRPIVLDAPYLDHPLLTYLHQFDLDRSSGTGDAPTRYYLRGRDAEGKKHSFEITEDRYDEGIQLRGEKDIIAKAVYLPHTSVLVTLEYLEDLDGSGRERYLPNPELPNNWDSFAIQIDDDVYTIPCRLSDFLENGWSLSEGDPDSRLAGADQPYGEFPNRELSLTNDKEQSISVTVYNTSESSVPIEDGTVGRLSVSNGSLDFYGADLQLPGGLMLGWATVEDVIDQYGEPSDRYENYNVTYELEGAEYTKYLDLTFYNGFLSGIVIQNHEYYREY